MTISRKSLLASAPLAALMPSLLIGAAPSQAQAQAQTLAKPNILLVLSDDQSTAFLSPYGDAAARTPNFARFAREGMRFDRAYVTSPQCVPSRASIMTGRSAVAIDMTRFSAPLPADILTYPEMLRDKAGYYTGLCGRSYHLDGPKVQPEESTALFDKNKLRTFARRVDFIEDGPDPQVPALVGKFLDRVPKGKPFFVQVGFNDPHRVWDADAVPQPRDPKQIKLPPFYPDTTISREDTARYAGEVERLDASFGRVLQVLEDRKLAQNTIVVFMGDNGASMLRGKGTLYEWGVNVPLLARWPDVIRPGASSASLISGEDIAPTFLQAAGLAVPANMTGQSFAPMLKGQPFTPRRYIFAERGAHASGLPTDTQNFDLGRCVVAQNHKLIYNALWQLPYVPVDAKSTPIWKELQAMQQDGKLSPELSRIYFPPARPLFEMYDLASDPHEMNNLIGKPEQAGLERELKGALQEQMILSRDYLPLPLGGGRAAAQPAAE